MTKNKSTFVENMDQKFNLANGIMIPFAIAHLNISSSKTIYTKDFFERSAASLLSDISTINESLNHVPAVLVYFYGSFMTFSSLRIF